MPCKKLNALACRAAPTPLSLAHPRARFAATPLLITFTPYSEVGVYNGPGGPSGDSGLSFVEARSHMGAWCVVSSPLILALDMTNSTAVDAAWPIITNTEAIAVSQTYYKAAGACASGCLYNSSGETVHLDSPGAPAGVARSPAELTPTSVAVPALQMFYKPLNASSVAVFAINHGATAMPATFVWAQVPGLPYSAGATVKLRDLWAHADLPASAQPAYTTTLASHDSAFLIASI